MLSVVLVISLPQSVTNSFVINKYAFYLSLAGKLYLVQDHTVQTELVDVSLIIMGANK